MPQCKGCNKAIVWGVTPAGGRVPLERLSHGYIGLESPEPIDLVDEFPVTKPPVPVWISHFLTCPKASQFSGKNKR